MNERENMLKAVYFDRPDWIPLVFGVNKSCWHHYPKQTLNDLMAEHPMLFPDFKPVPEDYEPVFAPYQQKDKSYTDPFGCVWQSPDDGITGVVTKHPLADWRNFDRFTLPDPNLVDGREPVDWDWKADELKKLRSQGRRARGGLRHGHTFLQLCDLRGYENIIFDMMDKNPMLKRLIAMLEEFNCELVKRWLDCIPDMMMYPEDLGMQKGPMLSVELFRTYIKPSYEKLMGYSRRRNIPVHMHSDGDIRTLAMDILNAGVDILNIQDLVNGIEWIKDTLKGKICIELDIDRQEVTVLAAPERIDALIKHEVQTLGSREGGLILMYGLYPGVPVENIKAVMDSMERYAGYFS